MTRRVLTAPARRLATLVVAWVGASVLLVHPNPIDARDVPDTKRAHNHQATPASSVERVASGVSRQPFSIPRDDVRIGLLSLSQRAISESPGRTYAQIVYLVDGLVRWELGSERFDTASGSAVRVPVGESVRMENIGGRAVRAVYYEWAPRGDRAALERESTLIEPVPDFPGAPMGGYELTRYQASQEPDSRTHAMISDISWTTNWTYSESLWKVYRYKPLVRPNLADWAGVSQDDVRMGMQELDPGGVYPMHFHESPEVYVVLEGKAAWMVGDEAVNAQGGTSVYSPPNVPHRVANTGDVPLRWLYFWWAPGGDRVAFREAGL